jgi:SAM-dependent methyltransferase
MRDLTIFEDESFDIVWGTGIGFVPDVRPVIKEAARVIRPNGYFRTNFSNPYFMGVWERQYELPAYWDGKHHWDEVEPPPWEGYLVTEPYIEGVEIDIGTPIWEIGESDDEMVRVKAPKIFRHTFSTLVNLLVENNFRLLGLWEDHLEDKLDDEPGSYGHWLSIIPDGASIWAKKEPQRLCKHALSK